MLTEIFSRFAKVAARRAGHFWTFTIAAAICLLWLAAGPVERWSDTWQLVISTVSSVVTFLMVFLIQNSQNRDTEALQIKLDELISVTEGARKALLCIDDLSDKELAEIKSGYLALAQKQRGPRD